MATDGGHWAARCLVTGAQGFLGRYVVRALLDAGAEAVLGVGRSPRNDTGFTHDLEWLQGRVPAPVPAGLPPGDDSRYEYQSLDLRDAQAVEDAVRRFMPAVVLHCAAALRDSSWRQLVAANLEATAGLLEGIAAGAPARPVRVVLTSSGSVYGRGGGVLPFAEDGPLVPVDLYGVSKRAAEDLARVVGGTQNWSLVQARVFNLVGPGLQDRHLPALLAGRISRIRRELSQPLLQLGPLGRTRDFVDVRDVALALVLLGRHQTPPAVVNVGSGTEVPARVILDLLLSFARVDVHIDPIAARESDIDRACADIRRMQALDWTCEFSLARSMGDMLTYYDQIPRN